MKAAYLYGQLKKAEKINKNRLKSWDFYKKALNALSTQGLVCVPVIPEYCNFNAHMFYIKVKDINERSALINYLFKNEVNAVFHYVPLHNSEAGLRYGRFNGDERYTCSESDRLIRLPLFFGIKADEVNYITNLVKQFYINPKSLNCF